MKEEDVVYGMFMEKEDDVVFIEDVKCIENEVNDEIVYRDMWWVWWCDMAIGPFVLWVYILCLNTYMGFRTFKKQILVYIFRSFINIFLSCKEGP